MKDTNIFNILLTKKGIHKNIANLMLKKLHYLCMKNYCTVSFEHHSHHNYHLASGTLSGGFVYLDHMTYCKIPKTTKSPTLKQRN